MHADTWIFIEGLFARGPLPEQAYLTLTALPPVATRYPTPSRHVLLSDAACLHDALERLEETNRLGWGACVGIAPRRADLGRYRRGGKSDLLELPALFVDVDRPPDEIEELHTFPLLPSCVVASGHGGHFYWYLNTPTRDLDLADRVLKGLARFFDGDVMTTAQSLRLPGSYNHKCGLNSAWCHLLDYHPERAYCLDDFLPYAPDPPRPHPPACAYQSTSDDLVQAITDTLYQRYGAYLKPNGWIAAECPVSHCRDFPGKHFNWNPALKMGRCFGRHGRLLLRDLKALLEL